MDVSMSLPWAGSMSKGVPETQAGFPRRLETLENENGHRKVMEHEEMAKSNGML